MTSKTWYKDSDTVDTGRRKNDFLFEIIVSSNNELDEIIKAIVSQLKQNYKNMSKRLEAILDSIQNSAPTDHGARVLKHGLLFFALSNEEWAIDILSERGQIPPERYELFLHQSLVPGSQKLLNGVLTSLWAYVEQIRGEYIIS